MKLTVLGCGDAFGSGGRLQTSFHVAGQARNFLIDCGTTTLIGLERCGLDANAVDTIFISHLHGDHFGGLVWWMLHAQHVTKRTGPLRIIGPPDIQRRFELASEALFPGAIERPLGFELTFAELQADRRDQFDEIAVTPTQVCHPSGAPSYALRFEIGGKIIAFSGDTEWVESLVDCGRGADLFICECYGFEGETRYHMNWRTLSRQLPRFGARRILLTHMAGHMLAQSEQIATTDLNIASDGLVLEL